MTETENKDEGKKKLFTQIIRFGFVGGTSFIIDYLITLGVSVICRKAGMDVTVVMHLKPPFVSVIYRKAGMDVAKAAAVGGLFGFVISLIYNYFMSMKFVFERRDDMNRKKEFIIFTVLSLIGLGLNELILYFGVVVCERVVPAIVDEHPSLITTLVKMFATGVVMVYNFISRKMTLEKKQ
ncbi:MAG: GtrA family protein [Lachnospiraceae bacterium]|nr:GtrA family protein [Lachnospiraceae bacterium]